MAQPIDTFDEEANDHPTSEEEVNNPSTSELVKVVMELKSNQDRMQERVDAYFSQRYEVIFTPL